MASQVAATFTHPTITASSNLSFVLLALSFALVIGGQVGLFYISAVGVVCNFAALALLLLVGARRDRLHQPAIALSVIPLITIINLSIPEHSAFEQTAIFYMAMLLATLTYRMLLDFDTSVAVRRFSKRGYAIGYALMILLGAVLGLSSYKLLTGAYIYGGTRLGYVFAVAAIGALAEEFLFRGLIQRLASHTMRPFYAVVLTIILYGSLSLSHFTNWSVVVGIVMSAILSAVYALTRRLSFTVTLNFVSKLAYLVLITNYLLR